MDEFTINSTEYLVAENRHLVWTNIKAADDVSLGALLSTFSINITVFIVLTFLYELLRKRYPSIYNGRKYFKKSVDVKLPGCFFPLGWVPTVYKVAWSDVLEFGGLDAYCFLRYIRMLLRITAATAFWAISILVPIYYFGVGCNHCEDCEYVKCEGFYSISMSNLQPGSDILWVSVSFLWLFSLYVYYVMKKEYRLFVYLRMRFMGKVSKYSF